MSRELTENTPGADIFIVDYGDVDIDDAESTQRAISALLLGLQKQKRIKRFSIKEK